MGILFYQELTRLKQFIFLVCTVITLSKIISALDFIHERASGGDEIGVLEFRETQNCFSIFATIC